MSIQSGHTISHYRLIEKIGEGGMGVVWKAVDTVLDRIVAIKLLPADFALADERRSMFLNEARLASSVSHSHIVQVHEFGRDRDLDFIVMEYVAGKPLREILEKGPLAPEKVARLGLKIAGALSKAHKQSLLHRDLKPANVLITPEDEPKLVDFGVAMLAEHREATLDSYAPTRTSADSVGLQRDEEEQPLAGRVAGTLSYMSPEQLRGEKLDSRTDVFSFGTLLYEMATGRRPFTGINRRELTQEVLQADPVAPCRLVPDLPLELNRIILKAMARSPSDRYQTMDDLAVDLKRLGRDLEAGSSPSYRDLQLEAPPVRWRRVARAAVIATAALLVAGALLLVGLRTRARPDARKLLVLPLEVQDQTQSTRYLERALAEALAVNLAQAPELRVLPVPGAGELPGEGARDRARAARKLGAGRLVTGTVRRRGDSLHASVSLLDTLDNELLWGTQQEFDESDLSELVTRLTQEISRELGVEIPRVYDYLLNLTGGTEMSASPDTAQALGALRRGEHLPALDATRRLVEQFPGESAAHALRTFALVLDLDAKPLAENRQRVEESLARLERSDPGNPYAQFWQAYLASRDGDSESSLRLYRQVLARTDLTPAARAWVLRWRGWARQQRDDSELAIADLQESLRFDPTNAWTLTLLSQSMNRVGRSDEAVGYARQAVALQPSYWVNRHTLALSLEAVGSIEESLAAHQQACELSQSQLACAFYALSLEKQGRKEPARRAADVAERMPDDVDGAYSLARYWALSGDRERALLYLERSIELGSNTAGMAEDPDLASLHGDPRFERIVGGGPT